MSLTFPTACGRRASCPGWDCGQGVLSAAARQESQGSAETKGPFQTFLNSEHPQNEMSVYPFWERKGIKAAEGKLRVFCQMEEDVLSARPRVSTGHPTHSTGSSCPAQPWSIPWTRQWDQLRIRGDWAGLGRASCPLGTQRCWSNITECAQAQSLSQPLQSPAAHQEMWA